MRASILPLLIGRLPFKSSSVRPCYLQHNPPELEQDINDERKSSKRDKYLEPFPPLDGFDLCFDPTRALQCGSTVDTGRDTGISRETLVLDEVL